MQWMKEPAMIDEGRNPWQVRAEKLIYSNPWIELREFDVLNPNGNPGIYGKVHFKNLAIGVIALDHKDHLWLVGQYRFPLDAYSWEIPEGGGPLHEDPLSAAQRELLEETGLKAEHWEELLRMHLSNSVSDELAIVYVATHLSYFEPEPEDTEQLQRKKVSLDEAWRMIQEGSITDAISVAAIQALLLRKLKA